MGSGNGGPDMGRHSGGARSFGSSEPENRPSDPELGDSRSTGSDPGTGEEHPEGFDERPTDGAGTLADIIPSIKIGWFPRIIARLTHYNLGPDPETVRTIERVKRVRGTFDDIILPERDRRGTA